MVEACADAAHIPTLSAKPKEKFAEFADLIENIRQTAASSLSKAVEQAITESGYLEALKLGAIENKDNRIENLYELINAAADFEAASEEKTLSAFLENAALIAGTDNIDEKAGQILLMTMHNSKGLEFDTVF